jgi:hypothetical protein
LGYLPSSARRGAGPGAGPAVSRSVDRYRRFDVARGRGPRVFEALGEFGLAPTALAHRDKKGQHLCGQFAFLRELARGQIGELTTVDIDPLGRRPFNIVEGGTQSVQSVPVGHCLPGTPSKHLPAVTRAGARDRANGALRAGRLKIRPSRPLLVWCLRRAISRRYKHPEGTPRLFGAVECPTQE